MARRGDGISALEHLGAIHARGARQDARLLAVLPQVIDESWCARAFELNERRAKLVAQLEPLVSQTAAGEEGLALSGVLRMDTVVTLLRQLDAFQDEMDTLLAEVH